MVTFINYSDIIGSIIYASAANFTGSIFMSLLMIVIFILALAALFGIRLEYTAIAILPLMLALMSREALFFPAGIVLLIYLSFIVAKNFIFR
jgi:hypothetical protein